MQKSARWSTLPALAVGIGIGTVLGMMTRRHEQDADWTPPVAALDAEPSAD